MNRILTIIVLALAVATGAFAQANYNPPTVYSTNATTGIGWTAGTVNNGGHPVAIAAGTSTVTLNKADCSAPAYANCNFVYANSSGTVAVTTTIGTALASGNTVMALIETGATTVTQIVAGWQSGTPYSTFSGAAGGSAASAQSCGATATCTPSIVGAYKVVIGTVPLSSGTPSTVTVTALPFTTTSFTCTATPTGNTAAIAAGGVAITYSTNTITFTGPNTVTTVINYICVGV